MEVSKKFPRIETDRLVLREMTIDDVDFYFRHFNNDKIVEGCCFQGPKNLEAAERELQLYCIKPFWENRGIRWGIVIKEDDELIGTCGFYDWVKTDYRAEIGYDLDPAYWGRGLMTEALRIVLVYSFNKLGLNRVQAIIESRNTRSLQLIRRLGFKKEGVLRQRSLFNGKFRDDVCFSLLRGEWT